VAWQFARDYAGRTSHAAPSPVTAGAAGQTGAAVEGDRGTAAREPVVARGTR
jgi:hypothetical protein